jgi:hypothetical protein
MKKTLPSAAAAFPESPRLTRRHLFTGLAAAGAAFLSIPSLAQQQPAASIRSTRNVRSLSGAGNDTVIEVVSASPFVVTSNSWILRIGKSEFRDYTYGPKGELNILLFRVPSAQFSRLASGQTASVHLGEVSRPGRSLGKFNRAISTR